MKKKDMQSLSNNAQIISAVQLNESQKSKILEAFPNLKNKTIMEKIDKKLIAGFIVKQESEIFDASINGKINYLLNKIYENYR
jgi:F0F1-type ATP synthase delta subunit